MLFTQTAFAAYFLPDDALLAVPALAAVLDAAKTSIRVICYGFDHPVLLAALERAYSRGIDVKIILDLTQSKGVAEAKALKALMAVVPPEDFHIGTSTEHMIIHDKVAVTDGLADVPDGQFGSIAEAQGAGYPIVAEGSFNWTPSAEKQMNTLNLFPSKVYAAELMRRFDLQWEWLATHESSYQPTGATA